MNLKLLRAVFIIGNVICFGTDTYAQQLDYVQGEILVQLRGDYAPQQLIRRLSSNRSGGSTVHLDGQVGQSFPIWSIRFDYAVVNEYNLLAAVRRDPAVQHAQFNHFVQYRGVEPDDPDFGLQWNLFNTGQNPGSLPGADVSMPEAWAVTTGGFTPSAERVVLAIIDNGVDPEHEDLAANLWINTGEIPDNGIDDDQNGFVDDYRGWNAIGENDDIDQENNHGTQVVGIAGAVGNNGIGVSGVMWDVDLMVIYLPEFAVTERNVLRAYDYVLVNRQLYDATDGERGAFIVGTNASWGIDFGNPENFPLWCSVYDSLGQAGILNAAATANRDIDVDVEGDVPTGCGSDFLVAVTNTTDRDELAPQTAFGSNSIDLAAPGEEIWTTTRNNDYGFFSGTSAATPHVTAAIGMLYSAPCLSLSSLARNDPPAAALLVKQYLQLGVDEVDDLKGLTRTGGRLNIWRSLQILLVNCDPCPSVSSIRVDSLQQNAAQVVWNTNDSTQSVDLRWRPAGEPKWIEVLGVRSPFVLDGLMGCTAYEIALRTNCKEGDTGFSNPLRFTTDGCCDPPAKANALSVEADIAFLGWSPVAAAQSYDILYRPVGNLVWDTVTTMQTSVALLDLLSCTQYEARVQTICAGQASELGDVLFFTTTDCGACTDRNYCVPGAINADNEWIASVRLHNLFNVTGSDGGYGDYTNRTPIHLEAGETFELELTPGFGGTAFAEYFRLWIDLNQNGRFEAPRELLFDPGEARTGAVEGTITLPDNIGGGITRLRIAMLFLDPPDACGTTETVLGEYEDYCVRIIPSAECFPPLNIRTIPQDKQEVRCTWEGPESAEGYRLRYRELETEGWDSLTITGPAVTLQQIMDCAEYEMQIQSICSGTPGPYSEVIPFEGQCATNTSQQSLVSQISVRPNPVDRSLQVSRTGLSLREDLQVVLYNATGQACARWNWPSGSATVERDWSDHPAGIYFLAVRSDDEGAVLKLIKR